MRRVKVEMTLSVQYKLSNLVMNSGGVSLQKWINNSVMNSGGVSPQKWISNSVMNSGGVPKSAKINKQFCHEFRWCKSAKMNKKFGHEFKWCIVNKMEVVSCMRSLRSLYIGECRSMSKLSCDSYCIGVGFYCSNEHVRYGLNFKFERDEMINM